MWDAHPERAKNIQICQFWCSDCFCFLLLLFYFLFLIFFQCMYKLGNRVNNKKITGIFCVILGLQPLTDLEELDNS